MKPLYRAFEDRYRGSRELIKERLQVYLPLLAPLQELYPADCPVLDLGCGRGEWLELLAEQGYQPQGVDLDDGMLEIASQLGLPAQKHEALAYIKGLPDESQVVVSGFHIAEHVAFTDLLELVEQALRVLKPAGLLILETPNPENLVVGTQNFYLDPTHERPLPHLLLNFLAEHCGFVRVKTLRLQENPALHGAEHISLMDVLGGVSPDYAIVAQKSAVAEAMAVFDELFAREYGIPLDILAQRYQQELDGRFKYVMERVEVAAERAGVISQQLQGIRECLDSIVQGHPLNDLLRTQFEEKANWSLRTDERAQKVELTLRETLAQQGLIQARQLAAEASNELLKEQLQSAQAKAESMEEKAREDAQIFLQLKQQLGMAEGRLVEAEARKQQLGEQLEYTQNLLSTNQQQLQDALAKTAAVEEKAQQAEQDVLRLSQQLEVTEGQLGDADFREQQLQEQLEHTQKLLSTKEQQLQDALAKTAAVEEKAQEAEQVVLRLNQQLEMTEGQLADADFRERQLEQQLEHTQNLVSTNERQLQDVLEKAASAEGKVYETEQVVLQLSQQIQQLEITESQLVDAEFRERQLEEQLQHTQELLSANEQQLQDVCGKVEAVEGKARETEHAALQQNRQLAEQLADISRQLSEVDAHKIQLHEALQASQAHTEHLQVHVRHIEEQLRHTQQHLNESLGTAHHWWQQAGALDSYVNALLHSTSWRVTAPLRGLSMVLRWCLLLPIRMLKAVLRPLLLVALRFALRRPGLRSRLSDALHHTPRLRQRLVNIAQHFGLIRNGFMSAGAEVTAESQHSAPAPDVAPNTADEAGLAQMTASARHIYFELKTAIEQQHKDRH